MKLTSKLSASALGMALLTAILFFSNVIFAQGTNKLLKIGTYDSRIVVFAYSRSDIFNDQMSKMRKEGDIINQSNDSAKKVEYAYKMVTWQYLLHQMVFSNGSAASVLELVKSKMSKLANEEGISAIVSKWELSYVDPSAEVEDITMRIAELFNPKENIESMAKDIAKQSPIPLADFTVEEVIQMWKQFESKNFKKN